VQFWRRIFSVKYWRYMNNSWTEVGISENIDKGEAGKVLLNVVCGLFVASR